jgi:exopolyphosphatase/guanosine-5'-triphosphate,3'-diphosphate pyrophosphatase
MHYAGFFIALTSNVNFTSTQNMYIAVLDLGTNTFHLLIARRDEQGFTYLHKDEQWAYLAEKGIDVICDAALTRAANILQHYALVINNYACEMIVATGTAAFRRAANGAVLQKMVSDYLGVDVSVLSGDEEARLIYKGVLLALPDLREPFLLMDIGGGSTEFIVADRDKIYFKKSYPIGATVMKQKHQHHEPASVEEIEAIKEDVLRHIAEVKVHFEQHSVKMLIGASGSFDTFAAVLLQEGYSKQNKHHRLNKDMLLGLFGEFYRMDEEQRKAIPGMVWFRAQMMVASASITEAVLELHDFEEVIQSNYALKEGVLQELAGR